MARRNVAEVLAGLLVLLVAAGFLAYALATSGAASVPGYHLSAEFDRIDGLTVGSDFEIRKKGDYVFLAEYRQVGLGSVDPNLNDGDFNLSELNFRGVKLALSYGIEPWLIFGVTYFGSSNLGGADRNVNLGVANLNTAQTIQVDLTTKF